MGTQSLREDKAAREREDKALRQLTDQLVAHYTDTHAEQDVRTAISTARSRFDGHAIRDFIPILVERVARRSLDGESEPAAAESATGSAAESTAGAASESSAPAPESPGASSAGSGIVDRLRSAAMDLLPPPWSGRNMIGPVAAVIVIVVVVALAFGTGGGTPRSTTVAAPSVTTLHGVIGSEKLSYFNDPKVVAELAKNGLRVQVEPAGSRQIYTSVNLDKFDFAFPSSTPAAEAIMRQRHITTQYAPFSSPMAIATFKPIVDLLTAAGVVRPGPVPTLDMQRYLDLIGTGTQWNQLPGNTTYSVPKNILVSTTDPRSSNSAAMYLSIASYVVNDNTIVRGTTAEDNAVQKISKLFVGQGYSDNSSKGPFDEYLSGGMGPTPMVLIYEAQYVEAAVAGRITPDMVLMYPSPTVLSRHTLVPMNANGDRLGKLLSSDPTLQQLAAEHGFRTNDPAQFTSVTTEHHVPVNPQIVDVVDTPSYDTLQHLLDGVARAYN